MEIIAKHKHQHAVPYCSNTPWFGCYGYGNMLDPMDPQSPGFKLGEAGGSVLLCETRHLTVLFWPSCGELEEGQALFSSKRHWRFVKLIFKGYLRII